LLHKNVAIRCPAKLLVQVPAFVVQRTQTSSLQARGTVGTWYVLLACCLVNIVGLVQVVFCSCYCQQQVLMILKPRFPIHNPLQHKKEGGARNESESKYFFCALWTQLIQSKIKLHKLFNTWSYFCLLAYIHEAFPVRWYLCTNN
jgi:hypothetical protein